VDHAISDGGGFGIVRDHQNCLSELLVGLPQHVEHNAGILCIQIAGWLVGKDQRGMIDERSGQRDALLFAAGEFARTVMQASLEAKQLYDPVKVLAIHRAIFPADLVSDADIAHGIESGEQIEFLKDKSDFALAQGGAPGIGELREINAVDQHAPAGWPGETTEDVEERGLAAARRANDADKLTAVHGKTGPAQGRNIDLADVINLADVLCLDDMRHGQIFSLHDP